MIIMYQAVSGRIRRYTWTQKCEGQCHQVLKGSRVGVAPVVPSPGITGLRGSGNGECWRDQLAFRDPKVDADAKGAAKCCKYVKLSQNLKSIAIETFPTLASLWSWYRWFWHIPATPPLAGTEVSSLLMYTMHLGQLGQLGPSIHASRGKMLQRWVPSRTNHMDMEAKVEKTPIQTEYMWNELFAWHLLLRIDLWFRISPLEPLLWG